MDLLATAFSTAVMDHAILARLADATLDVALHVTPEPEVLQRYRCESGLNVPPTAALGLASLAEEPAAVADLVAKCFDAGGGKRINAEFATRWPNLARQRAGRWIVSFQLWVVAMALDAACDER